MEKTVPREFFDKLYGDKVHSESGKSYNLSGNCPTIFSEPSDTNQSCNDSLPTHYMHGLASFLARRRRKENRPRRQRTTFSGAQTVRLEEEYLKNEYISRGRRYELAEILQLSESQIKIWYQNRRAKDKRIEKAQLDQQYRFLWTKYPTHAQQYPTTATFPQLSTTTAVLIHQPQFSSLAYPNHHHKQQTITM